MARRKRLLAIEILNEGNKLLDIGVPMTKVYANLGLKEFWSYQATFDIFMADRQDLQSATRPQWLKELSEKGSNLKIHNSPPDWYFDGIFPYGEWRQVIKSK